MTAFVVAISQEIFHFQYLPTKRIGLIQRGPHHHLMELTWSRHGIAEKLLRL
jgi:hypothetical protein